MEEYLQPFIRDFCYLQHGLDTELCTGEFMQNIHINIYEDNLICYYVCFKCASSLVSLINDLRSLIMIFQKVNYYKM